MKKNETLIWPEELDALTASPEHHKLLFENDAVRVLDVLIQPKYSTAIHTHKWPATLYIRSWSDCVRYDDKNTVLNDSRNSAESPKNATSVWSEPLPLHRLENVGDTVLHIISIEIKS